MLQSGICPFEVGEKLSELPKEQLNTYHVWWILKLNSSNLCIQRQLYDSMFPRLSFNYATVDYIISNGGDPDSKALACGIKGIMELVDIKQTKKNTFSFSDGVAKSEVYSTETIWLDCKVTKITFKLHLYISGRNSCYFRSIVVSESRRSWSIIDVRHRWELPALFVILKCIISELISINRVFASVPAQSGSLRSILQSLANIWISQV